MVQVWKEPQPPSYFWRGGGRGGPSRSGLGSGTPQRGGSTPRRGDGIGMGRGRGRGRGRGGGFDRPAHTGTGRARSGFGVNPLLIPVIFVPSVYTRTLFQEVEEILQPVVESAGVTEESHVPTADRVTRVFSGRDIPPPSSTSSDDGRSEEELEEIDFADMSKLRRRLDAAQTLTDARDPPIASAPPEEVFTGTYNGRKHHDGTPSPQHGDVTPDKGGLVSTHTFVNETTVTSVHEHSLTTLENSTATLVITEDNGIAVDKPETIPVSPSPKAPISDETIVSPTGLTEDDAPAFFVDTEPTRPSTRPSANDAVLFDRTWSGVALGEDDEVIVYVAPHPRSGPASPIPNVPPVRLPSRSLLTGTSHPAQNETLAAHEDAHNDTKSTLPQSNEPPQFSSVSFAFTSPVKKQPRQRPVFTPGDRSKANVQARKREARAARKRAQRQATFGSFGAILSEARLRDADERERRDDRWETRRQDDSDIDWGDGDEVPDNDGIDDVSNGLGGMDLDPDLEPNLEAMKGFVKSMSAEGSRHVTMDDIEDQERMRIEDEEDDDDDDDDDDNDSHATSNDTSDEEDEEEKAAFEVEEEILIAELQGERAGGLSPAQYSDEEEDSSDDELSPRGNFQARLRRVREKARAAQPATEAPGDDEMSDSSFPLWSRADADDDYVAHINDLLEMHSGITGGKDSKQHKQLFRAIHNGQFDDYEDYVELNGSFSYGDMEPASVYSCHSLVVQYSTQISEHKKDKIKGLPADLAAAWEKDRAKKAERKQAREEARLLAAVDPLTPKRGRKKARKAMRAAANLDPSVLAQMPNAIVDMVSLEKQIRRFIDDIGGSNTMVLPPMDKASRKLVHELALAFNLKSQSKGEGKGRYTTLTKTTWTRTVNEQKLKKIMKRYDGGFNRPYDPNGQGKTRAVMPKHKDGDEVGKACDISPSKDRQSHVLTLSFSGCTKDWRIEYRIQDACFYGMGTGK
ncbi:hypothetical protein AZE42_11869 [Rhizopogon vesiculosus]|uniref:R3H domain-containing protein n=1 Tax=Rhizopogon vesiculosus TaxID=180088 RepID=A0A1J8QME8_9AGAM|nr:hypothetical protein AZE42_11869 [Rhizopogon vesiculosus]